MLRTLCLFSLCCLSLSASAQTGKDPPSPTPSLTNGQEILLISLPIAATVAGTAATLGTSALLDSPFPLVAIPALPIAAACAAGALADMGGSCSAALRTTAYVAVPAAALIGAGVVIGTWDGIALIGLGMVGGVLVAPFVAAEGYRLSIPANAAPALITTPEGTASGLQLTIGL